jgi:signal transduction histidine kinase
LIARQEAFRRQIRILLWCGFGGLLLLMAVLGLEALSFTSQIEVRQEQIRQDFVDRDRALEKLRSGIYISGTYIREYLFDDSDEMATAHKAAFLEASRQVESEAANYARTARPDERDLFNRFTKALQAYIEAIHPALSWTPAERQTHGNPFMENEVQPRRMLAFDLADQIHELSERQLDASSQAVRNLFSSFRSRLAWLLISTLGIGVLLASLSLWRILALENETELRFQQILTAQKELKRLSAELLSAQENERRRISRELHDEVGQVLSAIMLGLGNLRSAVEHNDIDEALRQLQLVQDMTQRNANVVRNISLLLRPTMLDDLGLLPALKWLSREVSRASRINIDVVAEDAPDDLPDNHRTCVYRVVQEAVNNASKHAGARNVKISLKIIAGRLLVSVQDDGIGFEPAQAAGLGILGMKERIARLGGTLTLDSQPGKGSVVSFELPLPAELHAQTTSPLRTAYKISSGRL